MSRIQVFHFLLDHRLGGPHVYAKTLSDYLVKKGGFEALYVTTSQGELTDIPLVNLRHKWSPLYLFELPINAVITAGLARRAKGHGPTVYHVHGAANIAPVIAAGLSNTPLVWTFHETVPGFKKLVDFALKFLKPGNFIITAVSPQSTEVYGTTGVEVLPAPLDTQTWQPPKADPEPSEAGPQLLCTANLNPLKGQDVLLEALAEVPGPWRLDLIGQELKTHRAFAEKLKAQAQALTEADPNCQINFLGWQGPEAVKAKLAQTDLFLFPSRSEAAPIALLEALSMERAAVASDVGAIGLMIPDKKHGFIVPPEDPATLAKAINQALALSPEQRRTLGAQARQNVQNHYALPKIAGRYAALYKKLLSL